MEPHDSLAHRQTEQTGETSSHRRRRLMARLTSARAELLWQILDVDARTLSESPVFEQEGWTVKDLLAHVAAWDRWEHRTMVALLTGKQPDLTATADLAAFNAAVVADWRGRPLTEVLAELEDARTTWLTWLRHVPLDPFFESRWLQDWDWTFPNCLEVQWQHDTEHARHISEWREEKALRPSSSGPRAVLSAALNAARRELLAAAALVPRKERTSRRVCGEWTLKDVVGHLADWEWVGVEGLRDMAADRSPQCEHVDDIESWNQAHAAARREDHWKDVWADLHRARERLLSILEGMSEEVLARSYRFPWGPQGTAYQWIRVFISHDREHAEDLRSVMGVHAD